MQINDLILKYCKVAFEQDCTDSEYCYPLKSDESFRIYDNNDDRARKSYKFIAHSHDYGSTSEVSLLYTDGISIRVRHDAVELLQYSGFPIIVFSADEYFNFALSLDITVPYSLLEELRGLCIKHRISTTVYVSEINVPQN